MVACVCLFVWLFVNVCGCVVVCFVCLLVVGVLVCVYVVLDCCFAACALLVCRVAVCVSGCGFVWLCRLCCWCVVLVF